MSAEYHAEITLRLARTGSDGETLVHEVQTFNAGYQYLSRAARDALSYVSGARRKGNYKHWLGNRKHRKMLREGVM
jgi:hypothetical protein